MSKQETKDLVDEFFSHFEFKPEWQTTVDGWLAHFGVKGMRWGKRKARDDSSGDSSGSDAPKAKPKKLTGKEARAEKREFYQKKADNILRTAAKNPESLISVRTYDSYVPTIATGKEFMEFMAKGGMMDIRMSDIYATKDPKSGSYVLNENANQKFVRSDKKKK